ncbi:MAG: glycosyltransferase family 2 protein [Dysgonamonadaceae bacterium]|jgi:GT2 family glycosyltransferase|nr:glycosyltransferase family 2 protein [Dysgonamonadaceae bacterium]
MKLSIIIVNYNVKYYLEQCLDSVLKSAHNQDTEIFVVDNHSSDGSLEYLIPKFPTVRFINNQENVGFSTANNQAIAQAQGEYILLLNPDTALGENTLTQVCRFMDNNKRAGAVGVKMLDGFGQFLPESKRGFPSPWHSFTKMSGLSKLFPRSKVFGGYHLGYLDENETHEVGALAGAFMMLRRETIEKSGSLDNRFFMYGEDIDLSYRINQAGYANFYLPCPIIHYKGESTRKDIRYVKHFYAAMLIFFDKHYPHSNRLLKWTIRLAIILTGFMSAARKILARSHSDGKQRYKKEVVFNLQHISYERLIDEMDKHTGKNTLFKIYHPDRGIVVSANDGTKLSTKNNENA